MLGIDLLACYHIYYTCNRIEVLTKMLSYWNDQIRKESNGKGARTSIANRKIFVSIIEHHAMVKETMSQLENIFSPIILAVLVSNSFVICLCLMKLIAVDMREIK